MPVVIKMKGLPFESTSKDIQLFFEGLYLKEEDIHLAAYKDGKASGIAFAVFQNDEDARQAMFRNEKYLGKRYIELFLSSSSEMTTMLDEGVPDPRPTKGRKGGLNEDRLPRERDRDNQSRARNTSDRRGRQQSRLEDINRKGLGARNRSRSPTERRPYKLGERGRDRSGEGFRSRGNNERSSDFGDERQVEMTSNILPAIFGLGENVGVSLGLGSNRAAMRGSMGSGARFDRGSLGNTFGIDDSQRRKSFREESSFGKRERARGSDPLLDDVCVHLQGLPFIISEGDVTSFFKGLDVVQVKFFHHPDGKFVGKKTGEGYVEFRSVRDAKQAEKKHRQKLGHRFIDVNLTSKLDMIKRVEKNEADIKKAQIVGGDPRGDGPISDLAVKINQDLLRQAQPTSRMMDRGSDLSSLGLSLAGTYGLQADSLEAQTVATLNQLASSAKINPDDVAAGCVVGIRNLPSSVTATEIIDFFYGYHAFGDSVRIHYLAPGRSSGDAMVTLRNSKEAMAAVQELNHKCVGKRRVQLFLV